MNQLHVAHISLETPMGWTVRGVAGPGEGTVGGGAGGGCITGFARLLILGGGK